MKHAIYTAYTLALLLLFTYVVSATPILELEQTNVQPRETLIGKIYTSGEFKQQITKDDVMFFEGQKQVFFEHEVYEYGGVYYLYVIFTREGTFTLRTEEILFNLAGEAGSKQIEQDITVAYQGITNESTEPTQLLSVEPGIIYTIGNKDTIKLFNRGSTALDVETDFSSFQIPAYQARILNLNLEVPLSFVNINSYKSFSVPVIYLGAPVNNSETTNESMAPQTSNLFTNESEITNVVAENTTTIFHIELINVGSEDITNLSILETLSMTEITVPEFVAADERGILTVELFTGTESRNESITLQYFENGSFFNISFPIQITVDESLNQNTGGEVDAGVTCASTGGALCDGECQGASDFTNDGYCCYAECVPFDTTGSGSSSNTSEGGGFGWVIGLFIFIILAVIGYLVYLRYKKKKAPKPEVKLDVSKKKFENRMQGVVTRD